MPRLKNYRKGKRVSIWIPERHEKMWNEIENKSNFVQIALDDAIGIMTWAILKKADPEKFKKKEAPLEEVLPKFNQAFPLDPLTAQRLGKQTWNNTDPSQSEHELW